jgi:hypothetical protein
VFDSAKLLDSFEPPDLVTPYTTTGDAIYFNHASSTIGATRGANSLELELEGAFDLNDGEFVNGWGAIGGLAISRNIDVGAAYTALQTMAMNPGAWNLLFDVTTTEGSWANAPAPDTSVSNPGDVGPSRAGLRVQFGYDGITGTVFNTGSYHGSVGKTTVKVPMKSLLNAGAPLPETGAASYALSFGGDQNRFNPEPEGGAKYYIDNVRIKPATPGVRDVVWDFETDFATYQGWSDTGNSGTDTSHKHHIVTGLGATNVTPAGVVTPSGTGHALLIDTSNIPPGTNGFQWASAMILNADTNNDGVIDDQAAKTRMNDIVGRLKQAESIQFDITYHDTTLPPEGLPPAVVPFEPNAPWLKMVLGIWTDTTPEDGIEEDMGLQQFQYDNEFAIDSLGNPVQTSLGDAAAILTTELTPDTLTPDEPLTMTIPVAQLGTLASVLQTSTFENSNYLRFSFAVQTGTGDNSILAVVDNIRFVVPIALDGDFDHDGDVDGADLTVWKASAGVNGNADADDDGDSDGADFLIWQRQLGNDATGAVAVAGAVPEPTSALLAVSAVLSVAAGRRRTRR